jgi:hypothetical protein
MASEKIEPIGLKGLSRFGIGETSNSLYFDKQKVHTDAVLNLTGRQTGFAIFVAFATVVGAVATSIYSGVYVYDTLIRPKGQSQSDAAQLWSYQPSFALSPQRPPMRLPIEAQAPRVDQPSLPSPW